jgi:DNA polymerase
MGLPYLAGEQWVLDAYRQGKSLYRLNAMDVFNVPYDRINEEQRQVGKVGELALGYNGGIGAYASMAKGYKIDLESLPPLILPRATQEELYSPYGAKDMAQRFLKHNKSMSFEAAMSCDVIKQRWRKARPAIVRFWGQIEEAVKQAIRNPGTNYGYRSVKFGVHGDFLKCLLPSGRVLHYYKPRLTIEKTNIGDKEVITYMGMKIVKGKTTRQWVRLGTYGGKLVENIVQAFCRDLLAEAMLRHEAAGYPIVMHIHDEDMAELPIGKGSLEEFNRIAEIVPPWAAGMPIKADGWVGIRHKK